MHIQMDFFEYPYMYQFLKLLFGEFFFNHIAYAFVQKNFVGTTYVCVDLCMHTYVRLTCKYGGCMYDISDMRLHTYIHMDVQMYAYMYVCSYVAGVMLHCCSSQNNRKSQKQ